LITGLQKKTAQAIVKIFETGKPLGDYGAVTVIPGDTGHLSYGVSQASLTSGNLALLIAAYCDANGKYADRLAPYLSALTAKDTRLDHDQPLKSLLKEAGYDPVMRRVQDDFFDQKFWMPAVKTAEAMGIRTPLGILVIYDSMIHGSLNMMIDRTTKEHGSSLVIGEESWISHYIATRRAWLANHTNTLLRKTVYRMDELERLVRLGKWPLVLPLTVRGVAITEDMLMSAIPYRTLRLTSPMTQGDDVRELQARLNRHLSGVDDAHIRILRLTEDGIFGQKTDDALRIFQRANNLKPDGIAGPKTWEALEKV